MEQESIERLSQRARGAIITQMQPENSFEWYRQLVEARTGIDAQPDLKSKTKYSQKHSIYTSDARDTYMVSYVGRTDWGGMAEHIKSAYTITDGYLMLEVNALPDKLCVTFQLLTKDRKPLDLFCDVCVIYTDNRLDRGAGIAIDNIMLSQHVGGRDDDSSYLV